MFHVIDQQFIIIFSYLGVSRKQGIDVNGDSHRLVEVEERSMAYVSHRRRIVWDSSTKLELHGSLQNVREGCVCVCVCVCVCERERERERDSHRCTMVKLQGNNLELTIFATGGGNTQRQQPLTHSLSNALFTLAPTRVAIQYEQQHASTHKTVCPRSYIYTKMTFGLFTNIASKGSWKNIFTNMSPHPVSTLTGPVSSSGSVTGYPSSGFMPGIRHLSPDIPSGGTEIPTV